jgi:phosphatidylglycerol:prolipoprotein diacylglycerol transferase
MLDAALDFPNIAPILFSIGPLQLGDMALGPFHLRWYALAYIAGLVLGWRYIVYLVRREPLWAPGKAPITVIDADDYLFWATLGVIIGGRLGYVLFYMLPDAASRAQIAADPLTVFKIWEGGMAFHGGLIGVIGATLWFCRDRQASLLSVGDLVAAAAPIGLFFGRLANFVNAELWGRPSDLPWAMRFPLGGYDETTDTWAWTGQEVARHPSQLYEATLEGLVLFTILFAATHRFESLKRPGLNVGIFLLFYGLARASLELMREPDAQMPEALRGYVTMGMLLSLPMIAAGAWLVQRALKGPAPKPA